MTLGSKIKRKLNAIGSKIQDGYNRIGGKKALLGGALSILGASAAGILSHTMHDMIQKPLQAAAESPAAFFKKHGEKADGRSK